MSGFVDHKVAAEAYADCLNLLQQHALANQDALIPLESVPASCRQVEKLFEHFFSRVEGNPPGG